MIGWVSGHEEQSGSGNFPPPFICFYFHGGELDVSYLVSNVGVFGYHSSDFRCSEVIVETQMVLIDGMLA